eukprot:gene10520-biopygen18308
MGNGKTRRRRRREGWEEEKLENAAPQAPPERKREANEAVRALCTFRSICLVQLKLRCVHEVRHCEYPVRQDICTKACIPRRRRRHYRPTSTTTRPSTTTRAMCSPHPPPAPTPWLVRPRRAARSEGDAVKVSARSPRHALRPATVASQRLLRVDGGALAV